MTTFPDDRTPVPEPRFGRAAAIGSLIGIVVVGTYWAVVGLAADAGPGGALAIGLWAAVCGGIGYGGMIGAVTCIQRWERVEYKDRRFHG